MPESSIREVEDGVLLRVLVKPRSKERALLSWSSDEELVLNLKAPARNGKANSELLKRLSKVLGVSTGGLRIVAGHKSREKTILISRAKADDVKRMLLRITDSK